MSRYTKINGDLAARDRKYVLVAESATLPSLRSHSLVTARGAAACLGCSRSGRGWRATPPSPPPPTPPAPAPRGQQQRQRRTQEPPPPPPPCRPGPKPTRPAWQATLASPRPPTPHHPTRPSSHHPQTQAPTPPPAPAPAPPPPLLRTGPTRVRRDARATHAWRAWHERPRRLQRPPVGPARRSRDVAPCEPRHLCLLHHIQFTVALDRLTRRAELGRRRHERGHLHAVEGERVASAPVGAEQHLHGRAEAEAHDGAVHAAEVALDAAHHLLEISVAHAHAPHLGLGRLGVVAQVLRRQLHRFVGHQGSPG
eukprot:scaffold84800_cov66-Phaeocystis_antarctica.AAC.2